MRVRYGTKTAVIESPIGLNSYINFLVMRILSNMNEKMATRFWENLTIFAVILLTSLLSFYITQ
jgi:hypothetical protein